MVSLDFFYILQLPHTVISNSEKLTHPSVHESFKGLKCSVYDSAHKSELWIWTIFWPDPDPTLKKSLDPDLVEHFVLLYFEELFENILSTVTYVGEFHKFLNQYLF